MATHAQLGVRFPNGEISGCYVHYDGHTLKGRIQQYLDAYTMTSLVLLIDQAQKAGGIRSFHSPTLAHAVEKVKQGSEGPTNSTTEFLTDDRPHVIDEDTWGDGSLAEAYYWLVDYKTGRIENIQNR